MKGTRHRKRSGLLSRLLGAPILASDRRSYLAALRHRFKTAAACRAQVEQLHARILEKSIGLLQANSILMAVILYGNMQSHTGWLLKISFGLLSFGSFLLLINLSVTINNNDYMSSWGDSLHSDKLIQVYSRTAIRFTLSQVISMTSLLICSAFIIAN